MSLPLLLMGLLFSGAAPSSAAPDCPPGSTDEWCAPHLVALRLADGAGSLDVKQADGEVVPWRRSAWNGSLMLKVERQPDGTAKVSVGLSDGDSMRVLKRVSLTKGESVRIQPGVDVPADYFGPGAKPVEFTYKS